MQLQLSSKLFPQRVHGGVDARQPQTRLRPAVSAKLHTHCRASTAQGLRTLTLRAQDVTPEAFAPFGQVSDSSGFVSADQLDSMLSLNSL